MLEEKPDARQSDADRAGRELSVVLQIEEILTKLFFADIRWGFAIVLGQPPHDAHIRLLGRLG
jgi:hypothetical protein